MVSTPVFAQEKEKEIEIKKKPVVTERKFSAAIDVVYPYFSRGLLSNTYKVAVQPYLSYDFTKKITVGIWGSTNLSDAANAYNELDWYVSYEVTPLITLLLTDEYTPQTRRSENIENTNYFYYGVNSAQAVELSFLLDLSSKKIPIDFQWNTVIFGNDFKDIVTNSEGDVVSKKRAFSSYSEVGYNYTFKKINLDLRPYVGAAVINNSGFYGYYKNRSDGFAFINVGLNVSKTIKFTNKFNVPVFIRYTYNEEGNYNRDETELRYNFISCGITFNIR